MQRIRFTWVMPDTYGSVLDLYGLPKSTAPNAVREGPWPVAFKLFDHCDPDVTYNWSVNRTPIQQRRMGPCLFYADARDFPTQGTYTVEVQTTIGHQNFEGRESIHIKDWLIVSIGDSVASGEGAPERPSASRAGWQNDRCHRSALAAPALAARKLAEENPTVSVTFVHLACSGATIAKGLIGGYKGSVHSRSADELPPQVTELNAFAARRKPNIVLVSIGANDVGFSDVIERCARRFHLTSCFSKHVGQKTSIGERVADALDRLPDLYTDLSKDMEVPPATVYLTEYFDPTGDVSGTCKGVLRFGGFGLAQVDLKNAQEKLLEPLNEKIKEAVDEHHWKEITGIADAFRQHGYCAKKQRWITTLGESFTHQAGQGLVPSLAGTLHPNPEGYEQIAQRIKTQLEIPLKGACPNPTRQAVREVAYREVADLPSAVSADAIPCFSPMPINLPLLPATMLGGMDAPLSILIGLAVLALAALVLAAVCPPGRVRESAPAVLMTVIGAALIDLSFELQDHTSQAVVLSVAGAFALIAGPAMLWKIRTSRRRALIEGVIEKLDAEDQDRGSDRAE